MANGVSISHAHPRELYSIVNIQGEYGFRVYVTFEVCYKSAICDTARVMRICGDHCGLCRIFATDLQILVDHGLDDYVHSHFQNFCLRYIVALLFILR